MDKPVKFLIFILLAFFFTSCNSQDVEIKLTIYNKSGMTLDSIRVYDIFGNNLKYYSVKPDTIIAKIHKDEKSKIPKGERVVFLVSAFKINIIIVMVLVLLAFPVQSLKMNMSYIYMIHI